MRRTAVCLSLILGLLLTLLATSLASATRCQVRNVSFVYPSQAQLSQQIQVETSVSGSCASNGEDYYAVRVDLTDMLSNTTSSSNTPIGYNATNFNVTAVNYAMAPPYNLTWPLTIHVYVVRAGGTNGVYLLDYQTESKATIQVGATAVPEFHANAEVYLVTLMAIGLLLCRRRLRERS